MASFNFVYRHALGFAVPALIAAAALLAFFVVRAVRLVQGSHLATLPLVEQQAVDLTEAGPVVLSLEGPRLSRRFAELSFHLAAPSGAPVPGTASWLPSTTSGTTAVKMDLMTFTVERPGRYLLTLGNLGPGREDDGRHRVVLSRRVLPRMLGLVAGIVLSAVLLLGSLVLGILRLAGAGGPA